jgi:hypothetical protein
MMVSSRRNVDCVAGKVHKSPKTRRIEAAINLGEETHVDGESSGFVRFRFARSGTDHCESQLQSLAGATRRARHPPLYRHGLRIFRVLAADDPSDT